jgi:hypothetical protein
VCCRWWCGCGYILTDDNTTPTIFVLNCSNERWLLWVVGWVVAIDIPEEQIIECANCKNYKG